MRESCVAPNGDTVRSDCSLAKVRFTFSLPFRQKKAINKKIGSFKKES